MQPTLVRKLEGKIHPPHIRVESHFENRLILGVKEDFIAPFHFLRAGRPLNMNSVLWQSHA